MRITALVTCRNRRLQTVACLESYFGQHLSADWTLDAVVVDDGSDDGTADALRAAFSAVRVIQADGDLYWAAGMALAETVAMEDEPEYLLWLNDDVVLHADALLRLIETTQHRQDACIAVGAVCDPRTGTVTYSGVRRRGRFHPLHLELIVPDGRPIPVDTFNGNVVLVPVPLVQLIGAIDGAFAHGAADFDYGLRAGEIGIVNLLAPSTLGTCAGHQSAAPWLDRSLAWRDRLRFLVGPKGFPPRARARYLRRHGGRAWFVFWLAPYMRVISTIARPRRSERLGL